MSNVTCILSRVESGDAAAANELLPLIYDELRKLASAKIAQEGPGQTLQPTALVHEAFLRLVGQDPAQPWNSRGHFFAAAAEAMRRILVESARRKQRVRHGGVLQRVAFVDDIAVANETSMDVVALDESLRELEAHDPLAAEVVKLRYFAGLTMPEVAAAAGISLRTAERNWTYARAWLHRNLG